MLPGRTKLKHLGVLKLEVETRRGILMGSTELILPAKELHIFFIAKRDSLHKVIDGSCFFSSGLPHQAGEVIIRSPAPPLEG